MLAYLTLLDTQEGVSKFEQLYKTYKNRMYYIANSILKDSYLAEDAVHNAFLRIINNLEKIEDVDSHKPPYYFVMYSENANNKEFFIDFKRVIKMTKKANKSMLKTYDKK